MKKSIILFVIFVLTLSMSEIKAQIFQVDDILVGNPAISYADPEFYSEGSQMVFYNNTTMPRIWIAALNPLDATLISSTGQDILVDSLVATLGPYNQTNNGPEWGLDSQGEAVFYSKEDINGIVQYWRASNLNVSIQRTQLTHVPGPNGEGAIQGVVRMGATLPATMFFYRYSLCPECGGESRWAIETNPDAVNNIQYYNAAAFAPSFIPGTEDIACSRFTSQTTSEIFRLETTSGVYTQISYEPASYKSSIIAFNAPEYNNELMYAFVADKQELVILRDTGSGYQRFAVLNPNDTAHPYMYSPELFQVNGTTYFAVIMQDSTDYHTYTSGAIYVLGFGSDTTNRLVRRIDDGTSGKRLEPEIFIGSDEVFVFFNKANQLRRARTGVFTNTTGALMSSENTRTFSLFPNPASNYITISGLPDDDECSITVISATGQTIYSETRKGSSFEIPLQNLGEGFYLIQVIDKNGKIITNKFIKK